MICFIAAIALTVVVSLIGFSNRKVLYSLALVPTLVVHRRQWYRVITHGFVHGDFGHLLINMIVLLSFGLYIAGVFEAVDVAGGIDANLNFGLLYLGGIIAASIYDIIKRRDNPNFASIGASGAVSAVLFATIFFDPMGMIYFFGVIPIPGVIFGVLYLAYESYATRKTDGINHHAHIFGAIYGFIFPVLTSGGLSAFNNPIF